MLTACCARCFEEYIGILDHASAMRLEAVMDGYSIGGQMPLEMQGDLF